MHAQSPTHVWLFVTPWTVTHLAPLSMRLSIQDYQSKLPFPPAGDLSNPRIKPASPASQADSLPLSHWGIILYVNYISAKYIYTVTPYSDTLSSVWFSCSAASDSLWPCGPQYARPPCPYPEPNQTHVHHVGDAIQPSYPLSSPSPPTFNL